MQTVGSLTFTERVFMLLRRSPLWVSSLVLLLPAILWYGVFFLAPLVQMIGISFAVPGPYGGVEPGFVLDSYQELANPLYLNIFLVTLRMAFIGTLACAEPFNIAKHARCPEALWRGNGARNLA